MSQHIDLPVYPFSQRPELNHDAEAAKLLEKAPVAKARLADGKEIWLALSYAAVRQVLIDPRFSRKEGSQPGAPSLVPFHSQPDLLHTMDPPEHTRVKALFIKAFTPSMVERLQSWIQAVVDEMLDEMEKHGPPADIVAHLTALLPVKVLFQLFGIPYEVRDTFRGWIETILPARGAVTMEEVLEANRCIHQFLLDLVNAKRRQPGDDLISKLLEVTVDGESLSDDQLQSNLLPLLVAGYDTTHNTLSNSFFTLLQHPDQRELLQLQPERMANAVDELLRYLQLSRIGMLIRVATEDVDLCGQHIRAGEAVNALSCVANRDPAMFPDPDRFDITRTNASKHFAFGSGPHFCPGIQLSRLEMRIALTTVLQRFPALRLAVPVSELQWKDGIMHGPWTLPVAW